MSLPCAHRGSSLQFSFLILQGGQPSASLRPPLAQILPALAQILPAMPHGSALGSVWEGDVFTCTQIMIVLLPALLLQVGCTCYAIPQIYRQAEINALLMACVA